MCRCWVRSLAAMRAIASRRASGVSAGDVVSAIASSRTRRVAVRASPWPARAVARIRASMRSVPADRRNSSIALADRFAAAVGRPSVLNSTCSCAPATGAATSSRANKPWPRANAVTACIVSGSVNDCPTLVPFASIRPGHPSYSHTLWPRKTRVNSMHESAVPLSITSDPNSLDYVATLLADACPNHSPPGGVGMALQPRAIPSARPRRA